MELEELNKTQIVLLTLLVSFVTSIATGIVTVTLLDQAPPAVTQTINRIVERTVERVVPASPSSPSIITTEKETTIVVKEEDLITESIERNKQYLVRLVRASDVVVETAIPLAGDEEGEIDQVQSVNENSVIGLGVIVRADGLLVTDSSIVSEGEALKGIIANGSILNVTVVSVDGRFPVALLQLEAEEGDQVFARVQLIGGDSLKLGQTVIALSGEERTNVAIGIVSDLIYQDILIMSPEGSEEEDKTVTVLENIKTTIIASVIAGSPLLNIFGEVIGIHTIDAQKREGLYAPIHFVQSHISEVANLDDSSQKESDTNVDEE